MSKVVAIPECKKDIGGVKEEISTSPTEKKDGAIGLFSRLLDSLGKKSAPESPTSTEPPTSYYGVYIPCEIKKGPDEEALHVYKTKSEAMEPMRRYKLARFKHFNNRQDALSFALRGAEPVDHGEGNDSVSAVMGEKPYPFKAPSPQEMVSLRKAIEAGLTSTVRDRVWDNPRFLVSSGNTPAIMQEGSRYNALHVAAKAKNAEICDLVLTTVGDPSFAQALYGADAHPDACKEFASILVDRYLNTPDKAMNETPLHFAAKFGAAEVVDVLTSFPQCNTRAVNKYAEQPKDIICSRAPSAPADVASRIAGMLRERYYVPVLHSEDDSTMPTVGQPFTPAEPPDINPDPLSPRSEIRAFAGPMPSHRATEFRRAWRMHPPTLRELSKRFETVGRDLANKMKVGWKEYWPFLDTFTDLRTPEGLTLLENYLKSKYETACTLTFCDSLYGLFKQELSISGISLNLTKSPGKDTTMSPMSELCVAMKTCKISNERPSHWRRTDPIRQRLCRQPSLKLAATNGDIGPTINHTVNQLLCIERTCQVFAKRIADALTFSLTAEPEVAGDSLKSEAKHLQHTIFTYMDDERFQNINFALIHSRLAQLVVYKLKQQTSDFDDLNNLMTFLLKLRCPNDDIFSSDDESRPIAYKSSNRLRLTKALDSHVRCLSSFIFEELADTDETKAPAISEKECEDIWEKAAKCRCDWKVESFERNSRKNASFRKNRSILSTSPKSESFIRRLSFDHDNGDGKLQNTENERPVSVNSPAGDTAALYTVDTTKCQVVAAEISEDESIASGQSDEESFETASEHSVVDDEMEDASDHALAEPFIYGEEPSKMDRLVFDAVSECDITPQQFPNVYRWRHTVALYPKTERDRWGQPSELTCPSPCSPRVGLCSTPVKDTRMDDSRNLPLQVSNWLRVTGPNSPRSALMAKNVGHNVSFGF